MYILFPIGIMYYFGTNLDGKLMTFAQVRAGVLIFGTGRFKVDGFWPREGETHKIPYEKEEIQSELARLRSRRLEVRAKRLEEEAKFQQGATEQNGGS